MTVLKKTQRVSRFKLPVGYEPVTRKHYMDRRNVLDTLFIHSVNKTPFTLITNLPKPLTVPSISILFCVTSSPNNEHVSRGLLSPRHGDAVISIYRDFCERPPNTLDSPRCGELGNAGNTRKSIRATRGEAVVREASDRRLISIRRGIKGVSKYKVVSACLPVVW